MTTLTLPVNSISVAPVTDCAHKVSITIETYPETVFRALADSIGKDQLQKEYAAYIAKQERWNDNLPSFFELELSQQEIKNTLNDEDK